MEARLDPQLAPIVDAPPLAQDVEPTPLWMQELIEDMNEASKTPLPNEEWERLRPRVPAERAEVAERAQAYGCRSARFLAALPMATTRTDTDWQTISWFQFLIESKVRRALTVWPGDDDEDFAESDADGSAKVALIAIERSHAAWLALVERGLVPASEANPFLADLVWLGGGLEELRPRARAFVRPGFDEPEAVARLLAGH
jgi:hypothetical protein